MADPTLDPKELAKLLASLVFAEHLIVDFYRGVPVTTDDCNKLRNVLDSLSKTLDALAAVAPAPQAPV